MLKRHCNERSDLVGEGPDVPADCGPHKTSYSRFTRSSQLGVFDRVSVELALEDGKPDQLMIDATSPAMNGQKVAIQHGANSQPRPTV